MHHRRPLRRRLSSDPCRWLAASEKPYKLNVLLNMPQTLTPAPQLAGIDDGSGADLTVSLSDELLLRVLAAVDPLPISAALVCKRWLRLAGRFRNSLTVLDWAFISGGRLPLRFPGLTDLDLVPASFASIPTSSAAAVPILTRGSVSLALDPHDGPTVGESLFLEHDVIDRGLEIVGRHCVGLRKLSVIASAASQDGLLTVAAGCETLQELELHCCSDNALRPISAFANLQILRLVGIVEGLYRGPGVSDIGFTILAHGCKRLVKLELSGCEGSYDGISAIGRCCVMLEELSISDHQMDAGWIAALSFCGNLKKLKLQSCRRIDADPGPLEHLGTCSAIETVQLQKCQMRDKRSLQALFMVCEAVRDIVLENCWGLDNNMFSVLSNCRRVKYLSLEGCSLLTTEGFESVILTWKDLQTLIVMSCNNIKDNEVSPALSSLFSVLKELKWRPDSKSVLAMNLAGTGMRKKGGRFFKGWVSLGQINSKDVDEL